MSFIALYAENASVVGTYADRADRGACRGHDRDAPAGLSTEIGIAELDDTDGHVIAPFVSASDLLAADDGDAVSAADAYEFGGTSRTGWRRIEAAARSRALRAP